MVKPILNSASEKIFNAIVKTLPQSLLLTGDSGVGLSTIAKHFAELRNIKPSVILPEKDEKVDLDKGVISVDIMRRLYTETSTKTVSERIIIIDYAERMTHQAQNAFLKLLEEPGANIHFILVSHSVAKLLPTVISRVERLDVKPISSEQSRLFLDDLGVTDSTKRSQLMFMADGLPAELTLLARDEGYFKQRSETVRDARELLRGTSYQKLLIANRYKDNRASSLSLLRDASKILRISMSANPNPDTIEVIDKILKTYQRIEANGNIRLSLAWMVL